MSVGGLVDFLWLRVNLSITGNFIFGKVIWYSYRICKMWLILVSLDELVNGGHVLWQFGSLGMTFLGICSAGVLWGASEQLTT
jgi:hypothetical protein